MQLHIHQCKYTLWLNNLDEAARSNSASVNGASSFDVFKFCPEPLKGVDEWMELRFEIIEVLDRAVPHGNLYKVLELIEILLAVLLPFIPAGPVLFFDWSISWLRMPIKARAEFSASTI